MSQPTTRVLALLELLQGRAVMGGAELARELEIDRRTLRRYIVTLENMGIPITTTQGRFGGYQVIPGFKLPPMIFSDDEALALAVGLMAARGLGLAQTLPAVAAARAKLERVFPVKLQRRLNAVDDSIALELASPVAVIDQQVLALLCTATQERRRVNLAYQAPQGGRPNAISIPMVSCIASGAGTAWVGAICGAACVLSGWIACAPRAPRHSSSIDRRTSMRSTTCGNPLRRFRARMRWKCCSPRIWQQRSE